MYRVLFCGAFCEHVRGYFSIVSPPPLYAVGLLSLYPISFLQGTFELF